MNTECSFCTQTFPSSESHACMTKIYEILNKSTKRKINDASLFQNVDNLVFQGDGMKGFCYLGVLLQLLEENPNIFKDMKRVAGTSAGSLVALYLALGLDPQTEIVELLSRDFRNVLDSGLALKVRVQIRKGIFKKTEYRNYSVRDIFIAALDLLDRLQEDLKDVSKSEAAMKEVHDLVKVMLRYCAYKFGTAANWFIKLAGNMITDKIVKWLFEILKSQSDLETSVLTKIRAPQMRSNFETGMINIANEGRPETFVNKSVHAEPRTMIVQSTFGTVLENACKVCLDEILEEERQKKDEKANSENAGDLITTGMITANREEDNGEKALDAGDILDENAMFYRSQKLGSTLEISPKEELEGEFLYCALGELVWFILLSQLDANGIKQEVGLFSGEKVKKEMIENVIKNKIESLGKKYEENLTFKQLAENYVDDKGNPLFKPFYITAFNSSTMKTDVFSFEHTPNVVIADAVRASISIPVFFNPVTIRDNGVPLKIYYNNGESSEEIRFMDGGVLDNYPIWMFDEMKYYFENQSDWKLNQKIRLSNTRTLGFMILDKTRIDIYTQPYFDPEMTKMKRVNKMGYQDSIGFIMGSLFNTYFNEVETSSFRRNGDDIRSVYVDNLGMSALAFNLSETDKERIVESGKYAVKSYKSRFPSQEIVSSLTVSTEIQI